MSVVIIDNYDSFTHNLVHCVAAAGRPFHVVRNTAALADIEAHAPTQLVLSSGPGDVGDPASYGVCAAALDHYAGRIPVLGVCLGHQVIAQHYGAAVRRTPVVRHGWVSTIHQVGPSELFAGIAERFSGMRYHSLAVDPASLPDALQTTAVSLEDGEIMTVQHRVHAIFGAQFHPESIGTPQGQAMVGNFLQLRVETEAQ